MRTFFHGWRRKTGFALLILAIGVMGVWLRSECIRDQFVAREILSTHFFWSTNGHFEWRRFADCPSEFEVFLSGWRTQDAAAHPHGNSFEHLTIVWQGQRCGFDIGEGIYSAARAGVRVTIWVIPYWSMVVPLTLFAAYLILWKPRKGAVAKLELPR